LLVLMPATFCAGAATGNVITAAVWASIAGFVGRVAGGVASSCACCCSCCATRGVAGGGGGAGFLFQPARFFFAAAGFFLALAPLGVQPGLLRAALLFGLALGLAADALLLVAPREHRALQLRFGLLPGRSSGP
jgi:hypothetical protein